MKKLLAFVLCLLICVSITACSSNPIAGTWEYSLRGDTSTIKFKGNDKVVWILEEDGEKTTYEGTYYLNEDQDEVTIVLTGWGSGTYDVSLSIPQIDAFGLPHRRK